MGIKEKVIVSILLLLTSVNFYAQTCGTLRVNTTETNRKYFLLDSFYTLTDFAHIRTKIQPRDYSLVKLIIENGTKSYNHLDFFTSSGVTIKKIRFFDFFNLPADTVILSRKERRLLKYYEKLQEKNLSLLAKEKNNKSVSKRMGKAKFSRLIDKIHRSNSYLFAMYPVYLYKNYRLYMYAIYTANKVGSIPFCYDICEIES